MNRVRKLSEKDGITVLSTLFVCLKNKICEKRQSLQFGIDKLFFLQYNDSKAIDSITIGRRGET